MSKLVRAVARVQITVEVDASVWGDDCTVGQVYKQAAESGICLLRKTLIDGNCQHRIIGEPKVLGVFTEREV